MLKDCPSLPSIGMRYGMRGSDGLFHTFGQEQADLAEMMNAAIINFPSCSSDTWRSASPPSGHLTVVLSCFPAVPFVGFDANSLYPWVGAGHGHRGLPCQEWAGLWPGCWGHVPRLWSMAQQGFLQWLAYEAEVHRLEGPLHAGNGPKVWLDLRHLPMDGYHPDTTTVSQFHCCLFHCHDCHEFEDT